MRVYLVIIDESEEAGVALRFASRRAAQTGGAVHVLALAPPQGFHAFSAIQATIEDEARQRAEQLTAAAIGALPADCARPQRIVVRIGEGAALVRNYIAEHAEVAALVLAAAREGEPGPLVGHFVNAMGTLPCPLYIIPGGMAEAEIDRLT